MNRGVGGVDGDGEGFGGEHEGRDELWVEIEFMWCERYCGAVFVCRAGHYLKRMIMVRDCIQ